MARGVNKVILVGNLGRDPEVKYTPQGTAIAKFSLATTEKRKNKAGEWEDQTEWHNIVAWGRTAEVVGEYLKKGGSVFIEGRIHNNSWDDKETGQKKYRTEIIVNELVLLGGGGGGGGERGERSSRASASGFDQRQPAAADEVAQSAQITDEDIPF
jgi:single-strand DNA-binding protein